MREATSRCWESVHCFVPIRCARGATINAGGGQPLWPAGYLFLVPGDLSALSVLRWTAPSSGQYTVTGFFEGIDRIQFATADVHILVNGVPVLSSNALINTFGVQL